MRAHSTMGTWKTRIAKRMGKNKHEPNRSKGENCRSSAIDRYMSKRNRSHQHPNYGQWCRAKKGHKSIDCRPAVGGTGELRKIPGDRSVGRNERARLAFSG